MTPAGMELWDQLFLDCPRVRPVSDAQVCCCTFTAFSTAEANSRTGVNTSAKPDSRAGTAAEEALTAGRDQLAAEGATGCSV
jgi:hypothetical protein